MSSWRIKLNAAFQFEWIKNVFLQSLRIIMKSFFFNFLLFSSVMMNWCKSLQTNRHLQRLLTSRLIRMFSVMWLNPWFVKISSNILDFCFDSNLPPLRSMGKWQLFSWNKTRLCGFLKILPRYIFWLWALQVIHYYLTTNVILGLYKSHMQFWNILKWLPANIF